jgi:hypothetical protein
MTELPGENSRWRCTRCGNLTRFDVTRSTRVQQYWHFDLAGRWTVEQSQTLAETVETVGCRWCGATDAIELVPRPGVGGDTEQNLSR